MDAKHELMGKIILLMDQMDYNTLTKVYAVSLSLLKYKYIRNEMRKYGNRIDERDAKWYNKRKERLFRTNVHSRGKP